jgi:hypothetical protein
MDKFDIIGALKTYAETNNYKFLCGESWMQNYEATQAEIEPGTLILGADFRANPTYQTGVITEIRYTGGLIFGRKFEQYTDTVSSLDETYIQKYENRLRELSQLLAILISDFACSNDLEVENVNFAPELNKFDTNIDFMAATLTFVQ